MTDEQKAQQIMGCNRANCLECGGSLSVANGCTEFERIMAMAQWKEQQLIDKVCEWIKDQATYYAYWEWNGDTYEKEVVFDAEECINALKKSIKGE